MIGSVLIGLPALLVGAIIYSVIRWARGGRLLDPGPRSLKELVEQNRAIIHPNE